MGVICGRCGRHFRDVEDAKLNQGHCANMSSGFYGNRRRRTLWDSIPEAPHKKEWPFGSDPSIPIEDGFQAEEKSIENGSKPVDAPCDGYEDMSSMFSNDVSPNTDVIGEKYMWRKVEEFCQKAVADGCEPVEIKTQYGGLDDIISEDYVIGENPVSHLPSSQRINTSVGRLGNAIKNVFGAIVGIMVWVLICVLIWWLVDAFGG